MVLQTRTELKQFCVCTVATGLDVFMDYVISYWTYGHSVILIVRIVILRSGMKEFENQSRNKFMFQKFIRDAYSILILSNREYKT